MSHCPRCGGLLEQLDALREQSERNRAAWLSELTAKQDLEAKWREAESRVVQLQELLEAKRLR